MLYRERLNGENVVVVSPIGSISERDEGDTRRGRLRRIHNEVSAESRGEQYSREDWGMNIASEW